MFASIVTHRMEKHLSSWVNYSAVFVRFVFQSMCTECIDISPNGITLKCSIDFLLVLLHYLCSID